jgi:5-formaminoimidazole-4-carboxamide-1-(beta)-D-ribofuranosyl 5'-monophosphate synthetase
MYKRESREKILEVVSGYSKKPKVAVLGTHSALELLSGARRLGLKTVCICQKGRESLYTDYYPEICDEVVVLRKFKDLVSPGVISEAQSEEWLLIPHRGLSSYIEHDQYENHLPIPMVGSRQLLHIEDRHIEYNQTDLLRDAGINVPQVFSSYKDIDRLVTVKVPSAKHPLERANFFAWDAESFRKQADEKIRDGVILESALAQAEIQEHVLGGYFNADFFLNPVETYRVWAEVDGKMQKQNRQGRLWLMGYGARVQANLDGVLRLPAKIQLQADTDTRNVEVGHLFETMRESLIPRTTEAAEKFVAICQEKFAPGIIGVFGLQGVIDQDMQFWVYDLAPRNPGDQSLILSPYPGWTNVADARPGAGNMTARMIKMAVGQKNLLAQIVT